MMLLQGEATLKTATPSRLIQLTDTHLMREPGGQLLGIDTDASLAAVCRLIGAGEPPDALLLTGDLAGDESAEAYQRLETQLMDLGLPSFWLPGNHDAVWQQDHPLAAHFKRLIHLPHWDVLMLNTQAPGEVPGWLAPSEIAMLSQTVDAANRSGRPLLIATHHPLSRIGSEWLDAQRVANSDEAIAVLRQARYPVVVISGHVHQDSAATHEGVQFLTTPSTCVQFAPGSPRFQVDGIEPGCRSLALYPDGSFETQVERVTDEVFPVDLRSSGYA